MQNQALLSGCFIARTNAYGGLVAAVDTHVEHICGNEDVVPWLRYLAMLQLVPRPHFDFTAEWSAPQRALTGE